MLTAAADAVPAFQLERSGQTRVHLDASLHMMLVARFAGAMATIMRQYRSIPCLIANSRGIGNVSKEKA